MSTQHTHLASSRRRIGQLRLVRDQRFYAPLGYPPPGSSCEDAAAVYEFIRPYCLMEDVEVAWLIALDGAQRAIHDSPVMISRGIVNATAVHSREVYRAAIAMMATSVVLCHNHTDGNPSPSLADITITKELHAAGRLISLPLVDHLIVTPGGYYSFADHGML